MANPPGRIERFSEETQNMRVVAGGEPDGCFLIEEKEIAKGTPGEIIEVIKTSLAI